MERIFKIGHFRVPKTLTFKMRPSSQPFRVGQGLVVYSILGYLISGIQYFMFKIGYKVYRVFLSFGILHKF